MIQIATDNAIIEAVSRLNSFVRSSSFHRYGSSLRNAIYAYKNAVLTELANEGAFTWPDTIRLIEYEVTCHKCGGTGIYDDGWHYGPCYGCGGYRHSQREWTRYGQAWRTYQQNGTGRAKLRFVESTLPTGHTWHTPEDKAPKELLECLPHLDAGETYHYRRVACRMPEDEGWQPKLEGQDLTNGELAAALNDVEPWYLQRPEVRRWESRRKLAFSYRLHLGHAPQRCTLCGSEDLSNPKSHHLHRLGASSEWFEWTAFICWPCESARNAMESFMDVWAYLKEQGPPAELLQDADVRRWYGRRQSVTRCVDRDF